MSDAAKKRRSFSMAYLLAQCAPPLKLPSKQPTAYSYNGVVLPGLPEWDKTVYPYAYITHTNGLYSFFYEATARNVGDGGNILSFSANRMYLLEDGAWEKKSTYSGGVLIWSNTDVYYGEGEAIDEELWGTLYLAASDPIPFYE